MTVSSPQDGKAVGQGAGLKALRELKLEIGRGPICPHCKLDTFDDWWHDKTMRSGTYPVSAHCRLKCHGCNKFFSVTQYTDGAHHSSAQVRKRTLKASSQLHKRDEE